MKPEIKKYFWPASGDTQNRSLVVLFHAFRASPEILAGVREVIKKSLPSADIYSPYLPLSFLSCEDPEILSQNILDAITEICRTATERGEGYREIILVGHSFGSILARKIFVLANGAQRDGTVNPGISVDLPAPISRIVLLAGMNRGWSNTSALSSIQQMFFHLGSGLGNVVQLFRRTPPIIFAIRRGAPFLTLLRLQWLAVEAALAGGSQPLTIQLLGTIDDLVSPDDNIDLETGGSFQYLEVPQSGHMDVIYMGQTVSSRPLARKIRKNPQAAIERARVFGQALMLNEGELELIGVTSNTLASAVDGQEDLADAGGVNRDLVKHVIFVIHGIRDKGFWTRRVARKIQQAIDGPTVAVTSSYGYFGLLPFVWPWTRREKVEWLMEQYVSAKARYPNADFSYVGHSNGTYLLANALGLCHALKFKSIVFAGSVVHRNFPWLRIIRRGQAERVLNFVATADWVVAIFPKGLQTLRLQDLGSAGHDGFAEEEAGKLHNIKRVKGAHGAAVAENNWDEIVSFVAPPGAWPISPGTESNGFVRFLGWIAPVFWILIPISLLLPAYFLLQPFDIGEIGLIGLFLVYIYLVKLVMTKF